MQRCNGENAKLRRQTRSEKTEWRSAKMRRRRNDINIALSHSHLRIFVFAFLSLFRSITYNFIQVSFSPKLFRMILFVFSAHAPASVAAIVLAIIFKVIWYIFLLVAKPNHHVLHIKCTAYNSVYVFPDFCHLRQSAYPDSILWVFKHSNIWISLYKARVQGWEWSQLQNMHLIAYVIQITILQSCLF